MELEQLALPVDKTTTVLKRKRKSAYDLLDERDIKVAQWIADGKTYKEIAVKLKSKEFPGGMSPRSVERIAQSVKNKIKAKSQAHMVKLLLIKEIIK